MELKQIKCQCCGSNMELVPGLRRLKCGFCGANYIIEYKNEKNSSSRSYFNNNDNPADILLIKLDSGTIYLGQSIMPSGLPSYMASSLDPNNWYNKEDYETKLQGKLSMLAALSYLSGETCNIEVGHIYMDPVLLYHGYATDSNVTFNAAEEDKKGYLKEPYRTWKHHYGPYSDNRGVMKRDGSNEKAYQSAQNDRQNREWREYIDGIIGRYGLEYEDSTEYSDPSWEYFKNRFIFLYNTRRLWFTRYTDRRVYISITPEKAGRILTPEGVDKLERMGRNECIKDMCATIYNYLSANAARQLETRKLETGIVRTYSNYVAFVAGKDNIYAPENQIHFNSFGMSPITEPELRVYLEAYLINGVRGLCRANNDVLWNVSEIIDHDVAVKMTPEAMTRGVYNDWV